MRYQEMLGGKAGVRKHEACDGKGQLDCHELECRKGAVKCEECTEGQVSTCILCSDTKQAHCRACSGEPYRPFEVYGMLLSDKGFQDAAGEYLECARTVAQRHFSDKVSSLYEQQVEWEKAQVEIEERAESMARLGLTLKRRAPKVSIEEKIKRAKQEAARVSKRLAAAQAALR